MKTTVVSDLKQLEKIVRRAERQAPTGKVGFHAGRIPPGEEFRPGPVFLAHSAREAEEWRDFQGVPYLHVVRNLSRNIFFLRDGREYRKLWEESGAFDPPDNNIFTANMLFFGKISSRWTSMVVTQKAVTGFFKTKPPDDKVYPFYAPYTVIFDASLARIVASFPEGAVWKDDV